MRLRWSHCQRDHRRPMPVSIPVMCRYETSRVKNAWVLGIRLRWSHCQRDHRRPMPVSIAVTFRYVTGLTVNE